MLELFARHSLVDLTVACTGDLHVDGHHTTEDVGICLGQAIDRALGDRAGIRRYGHAVLPMDETLVTCAVDLGGPALLGLERGDAVAQDRRRSTASWSPISGRPSHPRADEPPRPPAPRPQHPPRQRGDLQGAGPRSPRGLRARPAEHRGPLDQGNALIDSPRSLPRACQRSPSQEDDASSHGKPDETLAARPGRQRRSGRAGLRPAGAGDLAESPTRSARSSAGGSTCACSRSALVDLPDRHGRSRSCAGICLVRVIEPQFTLRAAMLLGFIGIVFNLVIPGAVGRRSDQGGLPGPDADQEDAGDRFDGDRPDPRPARVCSCWRRSPAGFAWRLAPTDVRKLIVAAWLAPVIVGVLVLAAIFAQAFTRIFPGLGRGHSRLGLIFAELNEMSTTYRGRLDVVVGSAASMSMGIHTLNVLAFYLVGRMLFPAMTDHARPALPDGPLDALQPWPYRFPFGALGLSEGVGEQLFKLVGHPSGVLAMMGFRVLMYGGGLCRGLRLPGQAQGGSRTHRARPTISRTNCSKAIWKTASDGSTAIELRIANDASDSDVNRDHIAILQTELGRRSRAHNSRRRFAMVIRRDRRRRILS